MVCYLLFQIWFKQEENDKLINTKISLTEKISNKNFICNQLTQENDDVKCFLGITSNKLLRK